MAPERHLVVCWGCWKSPGTSLGPLGALLEISWEPLGSSWGSLGSSWESCGAPGRPRGSHFGDLGALLGALGALLGPLGALLEASWEALGSYLVVVWG